MGTAQTAKPVLVVSFPSYEKLMADVDFLGQLAGQPNRSQQIEAMIQVFTQGQGLKGLDKTKPWGGAVFATDADFSPVAFRAGNQRQGTCRRFSQRGWTC